jgi:hypothetical protein
MPPMPSKGFRIAQGAGRVDHVRALALGLFEQVRRVDVLGIERRVFAHDDHVEILQRLGLENVFVVPVLLIAGEGDLLHVGGDQAT